MNSSSNSFTSGGKDIDNNNCFNSKLRRFKIQEGVLTANVNQYFILNSEENEMKYHNNIIQLKKYFSKLKDKCQDVKHLFEEISQKTNHQETFENTDIDELKRDILELETKIRTTKQFIATELQTLRDEELSLMEKPETSETLSSDQKKYMKRNVPQIKGYNEIVPSPVRVMIHSPFKCLEVQKFQDFMKNSPNRYGGWNEYNHNIFVQIWNKYYGDNSMMTAVNSIKDAYSYEDYKEEVLQKISGVSLDNIDSHSEWYSKYLQLKFNQQNALNKWKENNRKIKPVGKAHPTRMDNSMTYDLKSPGNTKLCRKNNHGNVITDRNIDKRRHRNPNFGRTHTFNERVLEPSETYSIEDTVSNYEEDRGKKLDMTRLLRPTKQWLLKQESTTDTCKINKSVESIGKLRTPSWRLSLRE